MKRNFLFQDIFSKKSKMRDTSGEKSTSIQLSSRTDSLDNTPSLESHSPLGTDIDSFQVEIGTSLI